MDGDGDGAGRWPKGSVVTVLGCDHRYSILRHSPILTVFLRASPHLHRAPPNPLPLSFTFLPAPTSSQPPRSTKAETLASPSSSVASHRLHCLHRRYHGWSPPLSCAPFSFTTSFLWDPIFYYGRSITKSSLKKEKKIRQMQQQHNEVVSTMEKNQNNLTSKLDGLTNLIKTLLQQVNPGISAEQVQVMIEATQQSLPDASSAPNDARRSIPPSLGSNHVSNDMET
ncbi:uncharacterized protein LOC107640072 [Arachis ipaensis]|uniref:uncharacterized protein LOC107640072 n=1 Tax=Arachis ipaensis TaxID=130454 RepID=UPI0007AFBDC8|nr:uncharacterized protein LOC107640072 [Arachis ipaensis]